MKVTVKGVDYEIVYPCTYIPELKSQLPGLDIETAPACDHPKAGLDPYMTRISLVQIYDSSCKTVYVFDVLESGIEFLKPLLEKHTFIGHNSKFELTHLMKAGVKFHDSMHDTMLMSQLIGSAVEVLEEPDEHELDTPVGERDGIGAYKKTSHSLENCCIRWLGVALDKNFQTSLWGERPLLEDQIRYAAVDAVVPHMLFRLFIQKLQKLEMLKIYELQRQTLLPVVDMEVNGINFDWSAHQDLVAHWKEQFIVADAKAKEVFAGVNPASPKQMQEWLHKTFPEDVVRRWPRTKPSLRHPEGQLTFTATALADFQDLPQIRILFEWKKLNKLLSTYGEEFARKTKHPITQRIHTSFIQGETATGRLSSRSPNLQNQPPELRPLFIASPNKVLVVADFSQIELRLQAEISQDPKMLEAFREGHDIYKVMAAALFHVDISEVTSTQRKLGKVAMLSLGYGTRWKKLRSTARLAPYHLDISEDESMKVYNTYHEYFCRYSQWCDEVRAIGEETQFARTLIGKLRLLNPQKVFTTAPNHIIQGTAAELNNRSMVLGRKAGLDIRLSVHDEIVTQCSPEHVEETKETLASVMNTAMKEMFPGAVSFMVAEAFSGKTWAEAKNH